MLMKEYRICMPLTVEEVGEVLLIFASRRLADQQVLPALLCCTCSIAKAIAAVF